MNSNDSSFVSGPHGDRPPRQAHRRAVLATLAGGSLLVVAAGGRLRADSTALAQSDPSPVSAAGTATPAPFSSQVFSGMGFVGVATDVPTGDAFVAVVLGEAEPGTEAREARALLYGNPENDIKEWFPGAVTGNTLDLASDGGARLRGQVSENGASGTITMPDGMVFPFKTVPASGVAGLYTVIFFPDGRVEGTSERGGTLAGQLGKVEEGTDIQSLNGTLTSPDGESHAFSIKIQSTPPQSADEAPANARFVILSDGRMRGGARRRDGGGNFYGYEID